jgi:hypothetical protein
MEAGEGEPLIIVPATISALENWYTLADFMAQWFHVYFFELPGHGQSSPFQDRFSSQKAAELIEQLVDELGCERFNLMGFSFGGILAMQTFKRLSHRIERLILISPCVDHRAIPFSQFRQSFLYHVNQFIGLPKIESLLNDLIHNKRTSRWISKAVQNIGSLEKTIPLEQILPQTPRSTISVLNAQISEILTTEFDAEPEKYTTPCYFAMSINDPLLRFDTTLNVLNDHFENVNTVQLTHTFHQPPRPFTLDELNQGFKKTIDAFMGRASPPLNSIQ